MTTDLTYSIARIFDGDEDPTGTGILVSETHILTCAHVVNSALGRDKNCRDPLDADTTIRLDFPVVAAGKQLAAEVAHWQIETDAALLRLRVPLPAGLPPIPLKAIIPAWGETVKAFGFPDGYPDGQWVEGAVASKTGKGRLEIKPKQTELAFIRSGFSGGPVWTSDQSGVIGITVESDSEQTAYCIPTDVLTALWSELRAWSQLANPYRGLFPFREDDAEFFFGREKVSAELAAKVRRQSLVTVLGPSGSGKSSLVFAGLIPALRREENWIIAAFRPGNNPFFSMAEALLPLYEPKLSKTDLLAESKKLAAKLRQGELTMGDVAGLIFKETGRLRLLLLADQFEELYTPAINPETRRCFLDLLLESLDDNHSQFTIQTLLAFRADFLDQALLYPPLAEALQTHPPLMLGPMSPAELETTILEPAKKRDITFEAGLAERILEDVGQEPGNLPLLEFALTQLWEQQENHRLTHAAYEVIGQVKGALAQHAQTVYENLSPTEQQQTPRIFIQLLRSDIESKDIRRLAKRNEIDAPWELAQKLADARLLVTNRTDAGEETVEVVHEALLRHWELLQNWLEENHSFRAWQDRLRALMRQWVDAGQDDGALLHGAPLAEAESWLDNPAVNLSADERAFIRASQSLRDKQETKEKQTNRNLRRRAMIAAVVGVIAVIAAIVAGFYYFNTQEESQNARNAESTAVANANIATTAQAEAEANAQEAQRQSLRAAEYALEAETALQEAQIAQHQTEHQARIGRARELAALSLAEDDPTASLNLMLAREAVLATWLTTTDIITQPFVTKEADAALRAAIDRAERLPWRMTIPWRQGHTGQVNSVIFSPDGRQIASGSRDQTIRLWDTTTGKELRQLIGHTDIVNSVAFSPDGQTIVSGSSDQSIRLWNAITGEELRQLIGHTGWVNSVTFSPDGQKVVSGSGGYYDQTIRLWNAITGEELRRFIGHTDIVNSVAFSPDGQTIVSGSGDQTIRLWNVATGEELRQLIGHTGWVNSVTFSPDGQTIVSGSGDQTIRLWNAATGEELRQFTGHTEDVTSAIFSADGKWIVGSSKDNTIRLWDVSTGQQLYQFIGHSGDTTSIAIDPNGKQIVSGSIDNTIRLWDIAIQKELHQLTGHIGNVTSVAFSPNKKYFISGGSDKTVRLWDTDMGKEIRKFLGHTSGINSVAFSPNGEYIISGSSDHTIRLWDAFLDTEVRVFSGHTSRINSVSFSPDGNYILSGSGDMYSNDSNDHTIRLWNMVTGEEIYVISDLVAPVNSVRFSPDGKYIISGSGWDSVINDTDNTVKLWDTETGTEIRTFYGHTNKVTSVDFSPDSKYVASSSGDNTIRLWEISTGEEVRVFSGDTWFVTSIAFSPNGKYIISGNRNYTIRLWDVETGTTSAIFYGHTLTVNSITFSSDGHFALSGGSDQTIRLWQINAPQNIEIIGVLTKAISSVAFSPDNKYIVSGSWDKSVYLWETLTKREVGSFTGHTNGVTSVAFSPDGKFVASGSWDHTVRLWDGETGSSMYTMVHTDSVYSVDFSPDGKYVVSGGRDMIRLWDTETGKEVRKFDSSVFAVAFSPGSTEILSGGADRIVRLWNVTTGEQIRSYSGHNSWINSVAFSPNGEYIVSGSGGGGGDDYSVRMWNKNTGEEVNTFLGHTYWVSSVMFSPDGKYVLSSSGDFYYISDINKDHTVRLWDIEAGKEVRTFDDHTDDVFSSAFSSDSKYIVSGGYDNTIRLWTVNIDDLLQQADQLIQRDPPIFIDDERTRFSFDQYPAQAH